MASWMTIKIPHVTDTSPDSKANGANMGPIWGRQDPGGPHVGPMNLAIWTAIFRNLTHVCINHVEIIALIKMQG